MPEPPCLTCSGPARETVGMVCQTCGTDYSQACAWTVTPCAEAHPGQSCAEYEIYLNRLEAESEATDG